MPSENHTTDPSGPGGVEAGRMRRLHPFTLVQRFLISIPALFVIVLPALRNPDAATWVSVGMLLLYGVFVVPIMIAQYVRFRYAVTSDEVVIHKGVFTYQHRNIPIERIQDIEIEQSLLPRLFGTARVKIETAGSRSTEGVIEYVSLEEARRIRSTVRERQRLRRGDEAAVEPRREADRHGEREPDWQPPQPHTAEQPSAETRELYRMDLGIVLLSGVFRFSLLYIVAIFSATEYLGVRPEDVAQWFAGDRFEELTTFTERSPWLIALSTALMVAFLAWITGIATNLNRFYGFRLRLEEDKLHTRHGMLTVSESTIPLKKVQALLIRSNPAMSAFGWYRLELQTMGFDPNDRGYRVAVPFGRWADVMEVARAVRPVDEPGELASVSRLMIRRTFVRYAVALSAVGGVAGYVWEPALWLFALVPVMLFLAVQQYRRHGYRVDDQFLYIRRGIFRQNLWILPIDRFQVFYLTQSLFQRRLGLRSVYVDTAGAGAVTSPVVVDLESADAWALLRTLHGAFRSRFARSRSPGGPTPAHLPPHAPPSSTS